ncbi:MAG: hypothetical protein WB676_30885 [Bryobacteraceae bacterium]
MSGAQAAITPIPESQKTLGDGTLAKPLLIDAVRKTREPEDSSFIHTSVHLNPPELQFNTFENKPTKKVKISGVKLIWDRGNDYKKQMSYQGTDVLDLKALEMCADQVIIRLPLRFPRTDVTIHARELIFEGDGSINTTPAGFTAAAVSPYKNSEGHPTDKSGKPTYITADGKNGEKAGDIHLYVGKIVNTNLGKKRFICQGSKGQNAEKGGLKPYDPTATDRPAADKGKDLKPVTYDDIKKYVEAVTFNHRLDTWRWPGEVRSPEKVAMKDEALKKNKAVNCRLVLFDDNIATANVRRTFLPGGDTITSDGCHALPIGAKVGCVRAELTNYERHVDPNRKRPGDGENAYASGKPGDGGNGGRVISYLATAPVNASICNVDFGNAGDQSEAINGGSPGGPSPAYWMEMRLVRHEDVFQSPHPPLVSLTDVSAKAGQTAAGKKGSDGKKGSVETKPGTGSLWLHPQALGAVAAYARDAYRNGHRAKARAILEPYYSSLSGDAKSLSSELLGRRSEIESMLTSMNNNLDYYGNPPGWLPRLDVKTNYQIWHLFSQESSKILYFAQKMEQEWDRFDDEQEALSQTSEALKKELEVAGAELTNSYEGLGAAKDTMDAIQKEFEAKQRDVDALRQQASVKAKDKIKEQRIFNGAMKLIGGLAECIPVGQPYLGMAGKTLGLAGDFDWNKPDASKQFGTFFSKLSSETEDFLDKNESLFIKRSSANIATPQESMADLKSQIKSAKGAVEAFDATVASHAKAVDTEWSGVMEAERDRIRARIREVDSALQGLTGAAKDEKQKEKTAFEQELSEAATLRLGKAKEKLYSELSQLNKEAKDKTNERIKQKKELLTKVEALEKKKSDIETKKERYKEDKEAAEKQTRELLTNLSGLSSGVAQIGKGIVALTAPYDEKEVDRLATEILVGSEFRDSYLKLLGEVKELNLQKAQAVATFCFHQQLIGAYSARLSSGLLEMNALANQRQVVDSVLDPGIKEYLGEMQSRARDNLLWSQYHFVKAWQYEYLQDVGDDFYNLDQWVDRLREFERQKAGIGKKKPPELTDDDRKKIANTFLADEDFQAIGDTVRKAHTLDLLKKIINQRQHNASLKKTTFDCTLSDEQRRKLLETGSLTFNFIDGFAKGSFKDVEAKISDVSLEVFKIDTPDPALSISIEFVHSGSSILLGGNKSYYSFQKAPADNPIVWGFVYNHSDYLRLKDEGGEDEIWNHTGKRPIKKDEDVSEPDTAIVETEFGEKLKYKEYSPSFFSTITLWLNRGQCQDNEAQYRQFLNKLNKIDKVQFSVDVLKRGTI